MALANVATDRLQFNSGARKKLNGYSIQRNAEIVVHSNKKVRAVNSMYPTIEATRLDLIKIELQSKRPLKAAIAAKKVLEKTKASNRPDVPAWAFRVVDGFFVISIAAVVTSFFLLLTEASVGGAASAAPSAFAIVAFSIVGAASYKVRKSMKYFRIGEIAR